MAVDLWGVQLGRPLEKYEIEALMILLPEERRKRLERISRQELWREPLCAYALLRWGLRERYGWRSLPEIRTGEREKPVFLHYPEIHFNISHTDGAVIAGVANRPIGVDIEKLRPVSQRTMVQVAGTSSEQAFFRIWVRREARTKRSGSGIGAMLRSEPPLEVDEYYQELELFPGYVAGIAICDDERPEINVHAVTLQELISVSTK